MPDNKNNPDVRLYTIRLVELQDGTALDVMVTAVQQFFEAKRGKRFSGPWDGFP